MPQSQFIDSAFVANRDRYSTGAALGQVVHEFWAVHRQGRRCASGRAEASSSAGGVSGGLWKNSTYLQRAARAVHLDLHYLYEPLVLTTLALLFPRQSTEAFGRISYDFNVNLAAKFEPENLDIIFTSSS